MKSIIKVFALLSIVLTTGCAGMSGTKMSNQDREAINKVTINPVVTMNNDMFYHGPAQSFAAAGGLVGAIIGEAAKKSPKEKLQAVMLENKISFPDILKEEFKNELQKSTKIKVTDGDVEVHGDVQLKVNIYGLGQTQGFSSTLYPMINITATIKKPDGSIAWENTDFITPQNSENSIGYTIDEYLSKPDNLRAAWKNIAAIVSRAVLGDLKNQ